MPAKKERELPEDLFGEKVLFEWKAAEIAAIASARKHLKPMLAVIALLAFWALYNSNFMFFIILALWTLIMLVISGARPRIHDFKVTETGLVVDGVMHPYIEIERFWIQPRQVNKKKIFVLKSSNPFRALMHVPVPAERAEEIRLAVNQYVPQSAHEAGLGDFVENLFQ